VHARRDVRREGPLEVQAVYSVAALARVANVTPHLLRRVLRANDVVFVRAGRSVLVPLSEIESKIPPLWESIKAAEALRGETRETS
jgi:hypothetical protein